MRYHAGFLESQRPDSFLVDEVRSAMSEMPRALPAAMAFDAVGHALYARVTSLPAFMMVRAESELIRANRHEILDGAEHLREIVDLNAGMAMGIRPLLHEAERYVAVEPCRAVLDDTVVSIEAAFPRLNVHGVVGDPVFGLSADSGENGGRLVVLLGSYIGRFDPTMARLELAQLRSRLEPSDRLLVGVDLTKPESRLAEPYADGSDVYAAFARNALRRANREVGTDFRSVDWRLVVEPQAQHGRVEVRFEARRALVVDGGKAESEWDFLPGEFLVVERAYKPSEGQFAATALGAGFELIQAWTDAPDGYGLFLLAP